MSQRDKLTEPAIAAFLAAHPGWGVMDGALSKAFAFADYPAGIAFAVRVAFAAEKRDHHPDLHLGYRKVTALWSTHDAGGITGLDTEMAELCDRLHAG